MHHRALISHVVDFQLGRSAQAGLVRGDVNELIADLTRVFVLDLNVKVAKRNRFLVMGNRVLVCVFGCSVAPAVRCSLFFTFRDKNSHFAPFK